MARVVIDPMCVGITERGVPFDVVNLRLGNWVRDFLRQVLPENEIAMTMTSSAECPVPITRRLTIANQPDVEVIVSIGLNNFPADTSVNGFEMFHAGTTGGINLATAIFQANAPLRSKWGLGVRRGGPAVLDFDFPMITDTRAPATMVLPGFISNIDDFNALSNVNFQKEFGFYTAQGIANYLGLGTITFEFEEMPEEPEPIPPVPVPPVPVPPIPDGERPSILPWVLVAAGAGIGLAFLLSRTR